MRVRLLVTSCASCGASLFAAEPPTPPAKVPEAAAEALPAIFAPRPPGSARDAKAEAVPRAKATAPPRGSAISPELSKKISAVATRAAQAAGPAPAAGTGASGDSPDTVKLEPFVVREDKLPKMKEREMMTGKAMLELARRRYPGALTNADAVRLLAEDFAREQKKELIEYKGLLEMGGAKLDPDLKLKLIQEINRPIDAPREFSPPSRLPK